MNNLFIIFVVLNIINVILQTIKSICTVKCGKLSASVVNAVAYGLYTVVIIYTVCDLPLLTKALVVAGCNLVGVYVVKLIEEKSRKDKLWKVETVVKAEKRVDLENALFAIKIPFNAIPTTTTKEVLFNIYCETQAESTAVREILKRFNAQYFVTESKTL